MSNRQRQYGFFRHRLFNAAILLLAIVLFPAPVLAEARLNLPGGGGEYNFHPKTLLDMRFRNVVRQRYDYSCGSAALATLLTHYYGVKLDERNVLEKMYARGDKKKIHKEGFSLLDMKKYLASIGLEASGYRASLDNLRRIGIPAIVLINRKGYQHFVVIKGVTNQKVLVGDPALGLRVYDRSEFEPLWNKILFVIDNEKGTARQSFNTKKTWGRNAQLYYEEAVGGANLAQFTLSSMATSNYY